MPFCTINIQVPTNKMAVLFLHSVLVNLIRDLDVLYLLSYELYLVACKILVCVCVLAAGNGYREAGDNTLVLKVL